MAYFDAERREIVVRIVYDGLATAGKTANLRALYTVYTGRAEGEIVVPAETPAGRTLYFDWLELRAGHIDDWPLRCQLLTVPGQFVFAERRFRLLREIDAVVLVCDSTSKGVEAARIAAIFLGRALGSSGQSDVPVIVQANKQDLPGALSPLDVAARLGLGERRAVIPACATSGDGVRETLITAIREARTRVRELLRRSDPEKLHPPSETAEQLYAALIAAEDAGDEAAATALDEVLRAAHRA